MAAITGAVIAAGATAYAANRQNAAAKDAAGAAQRATNSSIAEQRRQYDQNRKDMMPWLQEGGNALSRLASASTGDMSGFYESPDYQFTLDQSLLGADRSAASRGGLYSGGHQADLLKLAGGLASQEYGNWWNRQAGLAGVGQTTASGLGQLGANMAGQIGQYNFTNAGAQRQSAYDRGAAYSQLAGGLAGLATGVANNWGSFGARSQPSTGFGNNTGWLTDGSYGGSGSGWNFGGG